MTVTRVTPTEGSDRNPRLRPTLRRWLVPYAGLAVATFLAGVVAGMGAMAVASPQALADAAGTFRTPAPYPETITVRSIFANNAVALAVVAGGAVSFGLAAAVGLFFNGLLLGTVVHLGVANGDLLRVLALVLPHGVLELPAFFVAGGVAYRIAWRLVRYLRGTAARPLTRREAVEAAGLWTGTLLALAVAAWVEAELTVEVARAFVDVGRGR